jgi:hypothetical protein
MAAVGALVGAAGSLFQGIAGAQEAQYQAQIAKNNAVIAEKNAQYAQITGSRQEEAYRIKATNVRATQKAAYGASGIDVSQGSAVQVQRAARTIEELDAETIRNNAWREAHDFKTQAVNFRAQAGLDQMQGQNALIAGGIGALGGLANAASSVSAKWGSWRSPTPYTPVTYGPAAATAPMAVPIISSETYGPNISPAFGAAGARS